jgi:hypothetical protein
MASPNGTAVALAVLAGGTLLYLWSKGSSASAATLPAVPAGTPISPANLPSMVVQPTPNGPVAPGTLNDPGGNPENDFPLPPQGA